MNLGLGNVLCRLVTNILNDLRMKNTIVTDEDTVKSVKKYLKLNIRQSDSSLFR